MAVIDRKPPLGLEHSQVPATPPSSISSTMDVFGADLPVAVIAALVGAISAGAFAGANEGLKRVWLRSDRMRLLRAEYSYLERHYAATARIYAASATLSALDLERGKYRSEGLFSLDVSGFAALSAKTVEKAFQVLNFVRNTDLLLDEAIKEVQKAKKPLSGERLGEIKMRTEQSLRVAKAALASV